MTISGNYPSPVIVNGFSCLNCTDVGLATKNVDPAHPRSGANNADAASDPSQPIETRLKLAKDKAAKSGGSPTTYTAAAKGGSGITIGSVVNYRA